MTIDEALIIIKKYNACDNESPKNCLDMICKECEHNFDDEEFRKVFQEIESWLEELKFVRQWKADVMEDFCKYDASSIDEVYKYGIARGRKETIDEIFDKADEMQKEQIELLSKSGRRNGKTYAKYMATYLGHIKASCERLKEKNDE